MIEPREDRQRQIAEVLARYDRLADALLALGTSTEPVDRARLREDLAGLLERYFPRSIGEISLRSALGDVLVIVRRHGLRLPPDLALLLTVLLVAEGLVAVLDPDFRFAEALAPYARRQLLAQVSPAAVRQRVEEFGADLAELAADFPGGWTAC